MEYFFWDLPSGIPVGSGILLSDMNGQTFYTIPSLNHLWTDASFEHQQALRPGQYSRAWSICSEIESSYKKDILVEDG